MTYRKSPERPLKAGEKRRTFTDEDGTYWDVREMRMTEYDRRSSQCLIFESINAIRRVRNYPSDWFESTERELAELSRRI